uniref:Transmembrane protein 54 n=1 Tax=Leptobrachium leishanense TaxID=445787 RepID=A0A8C5M2S4_9ANUR
MNTYNYQNSLNAINCQRIMGRLDSPPFGKILMKLGLALIVVGHLNFIFGAIVHGLVLRHVSELKDTVSVHYSMANITAVASAILVIANVYIESVFFPPQRWALLTLGIINAMLSAACTVGTAVSIIITLANQGRTLLSSCTYTNLELIQISHECPFDPTRIYVSGIICDTQAHEGFADMPSKLHSSERKNLIVICLKGVSGGIKVFQSNLSKACLMMVNMQRLGFVLILSEPTMSHRGPH